MQVEWSQSAEEDWPGSIGEEGGEGEGEGRVTSPGHPAHDNRREDGVWEKRGGAEAEREGSRGEGGSDTARARARTQDTGQDEGETHREIRKKKTKRK